jgi:hypothetical protein
VARKGGSRLVSLRISLPVRPKEFVLSRWLRSLGLLVLVVVALVLPSAVPARTPLAHAARTCGVGSGRGYGYSYLTSLSVHNTTCSTGRYVARHHGHVSGWSCSRKVLDRSPVQYDARVTCKRGSRTVQWTYTQNT